MRKRLEFFMLPLTGASRVSDSVFGQATDITRLSESAEMLTALAGNLQGAVGRFRVDDAATAAPENPIQLRKFPRFRVNFPLTYSVDGDSVLKTNRAQDLGGGGICFQSEQRFAESTPMKIRFELRPGQKIEAHSVF